MCLPLCGLCTGLCGGAFQPVCSPAPARAPMPAGVCLKQYVWWSAVDFPCDSSCSLHPPILSWNPLFLKPELQPHSPPHSVFSIITILWGLGESPQLLILLYKIKLKIKGRHFTQIGFIITYHFRYSSHLGCLNTVSPVSWGQVKYNSFFSGVPWPWQIWGYWLLCRRLSAWICLIPFPWLVWGYVFVRRLGEVPFRHRAVSVLSPGAVTNTLRRTA